VILALFLTGIVLLVGSVIFVWWFFRRLSRYTQDAGATGARERESADSSRSVQEWLGITDIQRSVITLPGNRHRAILEVESINYSLLSEEEQEALEIAFSQFLARLNFPIQFYDQARPLDMSQFVERLRQQARQAPEKLKEYMEQTIEYMAQWTAERPIMVRKKYIVVPYDAPPDMPVEDAWAELERRVSVVQDGLASCQLRSRVLYTDEILDVLYVALNKSKAEKMRFANAITGDYLAWEVRGDDVAVHPQWNQAKDEIEVGTGYALKKRA